jgi:putative redox protein
MVNISIRYTGDLHCVAVHDPSKSEIATDAPVDNNGKGEAFSPTDLVATALGTCMATVMSIAAQRHQIELNGMTVEITKEMSKDTPRRIVRLASEMRIPLPADHPQRQLLEAAALGCPVHHSLHPDVETRVNVVGEG